MENQEVNDLIRDHVFRGTLAEYRRGDELIYPAEDWSDSGWHMWGAHQDHTSDGKTVEVEGLGGVRLTEDYSAGGDYSGDMHKVFEVTHEDGTVRFYLLEGTWRSYDGTEWYEPLHRAVQQERVTREWVAATQ